MAIAVAIERIYAGGLEADPGTYSAAQWMGGAFASVAIAEAVFHRTLHPRRRPLLLMIVFPPVAYAIAFFGWFYYDDPEVRKKHRERQELEDEIKRIERERERERSYAPTPRGQRYRPSAVIGVDYHTAPLLEQSPSRTKAARA